MLIICTFKSIKIAISQPHTRGGSNRKLFYLSLNLMNVMTFGTSREGAYSKLLKVLRVETVLISVSFGSSRMCETKH